MTRLLERLRTLPAPQWAIQTALPLVGYAAFTLVWIGRGVVFHPTTKVLGNADRDKTILMWSFRWWPHAIANGHDPFVANVVWAPHGVDLAWVTSSPTLALVLSPLTAAFGPVFSYNFAALAAPPLAAWTAYLLARRLTGNIPASLVAGFLFGFSPYVISQSITHLNLSFVCLVPLAGLLAVRFFEGSLGRWRFTALLTLVLVLQFGISTEIFATLTLFAVICFVLAFFLLDPRRRLAALGRYTALAYLATGVVVTPYLYHAFVSGSEPVRRLAHIHGLDIANLFIPTETTWLRLPGSDSITARFTSGIPELGGYLGVPLLLILVLAVLMERAGRVRRGVWMLALATLAAYVLAVGIKVSLDGNKLGTGVWTLIERLPAIGAAIPIRLVMYATLFTALVVALWLAQPGPRRGRYVLAGLAVITFLPTPSGAFWTSRVHEPRFFATSVYRDYIRPGDRALVLPYVERDSWSMLWQAETGFRFSMIGGHIGQAIIPEECGWAGVWSSFAGGAPHGGPGRIRRFLISHGVNVIIEGLETGAWSKLLIKAALPDVTPVSAAGVKVYFLPPRLSRDLPPGGATVIPPLKLKNAIGRAVCGR